MGKGQVPGFEVAPGVYKPLILVTMRLNGAEKEKLCIVDSGADGSLVSAEWLTECGVDYATLPNPITAKSADGKQQMEIKRIQGELIYEGKCFATIFAVADPGPENPLLGRADFFKAFAVNFNGWTVDPPYLRIVKV